MLVVVEGHFQRLSAQHFRALSMVKVLKDYDAELGIVILTVESPPLATTKHTILASALVDGSIVLEDEIDRLTAEANEKLAIHEAVLGMIE